MQRNRDENGEIVIDLREIFYLLRKKALIIILTALLFAVASGIISFYVIDAEYSSTSKLYILSQSTSITSIADIQVGSSLATDYLELIKSRPVVEQVIENLDLNMKYETLLGKLTVTNPEETRILNITVLDENPRMAKEIANDFATVSRKQISDIMKTDEPSVVEEAIVAKKPASPNKKMNILIGLLLGALLSILIIFIRYFMDDTIKSADDVEAYLELNTLAVVPLKPGEIKQKKKLLSGRGKRK